MLRVQEEAPALMSELYPDPPIPRTRQFSVDLHWRLVGAEILYPDGAPIPGAKINMKVHRAMFPNCLLVLTTGAASLNARVGDHVYMGTCSGQFRDDRDTPHCLLTKAS